MSLDPSTLLAILAMAFATIATRFAGLLMVRHVVLRGRAKRALTAVPPAVLMAVVTPTAFASGLPETIACGITAFAALRFSLLPSAVIGVVSVVALRAIL